MSEKIPLLYHAPFVDSVFHPSDFSESSENAFVHALAVALARKTKFTILHAEGSRADWRSFPAVRTTLERWGLLEEGSSKGPSFPSSPCGSRRSISRAAPSRPR